MNMSTPKFVFNKKDRVGEIIIYDDIGEDFFGDGISAKDIKTQLDKMGTVDRIVVRINSMGGSVFDGIPIANLIKAHPAPVETVIDGFAASISSVIAMAADTVTIAENGWIIVHDPFVVAGGTASDLRTAADDLDRVKDSIISVYQNKTNQTREVLSDLMTQETWMDSAKSVELGFADEVGSPSSVVLNHVDKKVFKNAPEKFMNIKPAMVNKKVAAIRASMNLSLHRRGL